MSPDIPWVVVGQQGVGDKPHKLNFGTHPTPIYGCEHAASAVGRLVSSDTQFTSKATPTFPKWRRQAQGRLPEG